MRNEQNDPPNSGTDHQSTRTSISSERFALGVLALYALNFGYLVLAAVITPFVLVIGGILLEQLEIVPRVDPANQNIILWAAIVACLILIATLGYFFCWGAKSILRGRAISAVVFLTVLVALHVFWVMLFGFRVMPINWFGAAIGCLSIVLVKVRWKSLFPTR